MQNDLFQRYYAPLEDAASQTEVLKLAIQKSGRLF
jgi:hypothetical protein